MAMKTLSDPCEASKRPALRQMTELVYAFPHGGGIAASNAL